MFKSTHIAAALTGLILLTPPAFAQAADTDFSFSEELRAEVAAFRAARAELRAEIHEALEGRA